MESELKNILEAVLMVADAPIGVARMQKLFPDDSQPSAEDINRALTELQTECEPRGIELRKIGNGWRFQSRQKYADWIQKLHATRPPRLSRALLETLAIIAYRQPVTRGDIEEIRGVTVTTEIMRRLQERNWIKEVGARDVPGHPSLFATTVEFLAYFNLQSLKDLPPLEQQRDVTEIAAEMDTPVPPDILAQLQAAVKGEVAVGGDDASDGDNASASDAASGDASDNAGDSASDNASASDAASDNASADDSDASSVDVSADNAHNNARNKMHTKSSGKTKTNGKRKGNGKQPPRGTARKRRKS